MAKKKVAGSNRRSASKSKARTPSLGFSILWDKEFQDTSLLILPFARPAKAELLSALKQEIKAAFPESAEFHYTRAEVIMQAETEGRVLYGWSPWRAKSDCLRWSEWDEFAQRWFDCVPRLENRPTPYGEEKQDSVTALCREVEHLLNRKLLSLCTRWPFGFTPGKD